MIRAAHLKALLSLVVVALAAFALTGTASAGPDSTALPAGWTWDRSSALTASDGWTWDDSAVVMPSGWTWDDGASSSPA
jgi:hypothetical protein